jgi:thiol-disulfide isomerase/thioredoxin
LLLVVWLLVPVAAVLLVVVSLTGDDDEPSSSQRLGLGLADVDVQAPALQRQRVAAGIADCPPPTEPRPEPGLPELRLPCLGGDTDVDLAGLSGPLVLNVWAQSCGPCRDEMPLLQRLHTSSGPVGVLGIDFQDVRPEMALDLARASGVTYPSVADVEGVTKAALRVTNLPMTFFVDSDGRVTHTELGAFSSYADLVEAVDQHLGVRW